jgi:hypothetical protein
MFRVHPHDLRKFAFRPRPYFPLFLAIEKSVWQRVDFLAPDATIGGRYVFGSQTRIGGHNVMDRHVPGRFYIVS